MDFIIFSLIIRFMRNAVLISTSRDRQLSEKAAGILSSQGLSISILRPETISGCNFDQEGRTCSCFIENLHDDLTYKIRKQFFRGNIPFFSFGSFDNEEIICCKGSLDIGADWDMLKGTENFPDRTGIPYPCGFNGLLAIETPPDTIPHKYLFHFKYPANIAATYISIMDKKNEKHGPVKIIPSCGSLDLGKFFGHRAADCTDISELAAGTTVLTWSTERFFALLKLGLRPVPVSRCLALWAYGQRKRDLAEMIVKGPVDGRMDVISKFISSSSISKIASKTS